MTTDICDMPAIGLMVDWMSTVACAAEDPEIIPEALMEAYEEEPIGVTPMEMVPWLLPEMWCLLMELDG